MSEENTTPQPTTQQKAQNNLGIPVAIVIAAAIIGGAIYFNGQNAAPAGNQGLTGANGQEQITPETTIVPVSEDDHIRGNPNAPIVIVEYSDYDCPFCKNFHETMNRVMSEYGADGTVAWAYRHFPLEQLHPNAPAIAAASECVAELGGNDAFWEFSDLIFSERTTNAQTDPARLPEFAEKAGVDKGKFELCANSGKYNEKVAKSIEEAIAAGARGTPYSIVMVGGKQGIINGAQPYTNVKQILDNLISQIEAGAE